jgi:hypothetical protein
MVAADSMAVADFMAAVSMASMAAVSVAALSAGRPLSGIAATFTAGISSVRDSTAAITRIITARAAG